MIRQIAFVAALSLTLGSVQAQSIAASPLPDATPPAPSAEGNALPPPPPPVQGTTTQLSGTIERFLVNPNGDVDALLLQDHIQIDIPPHLSAMLVTRVHTGERIRITGYRIGTLPIMRATLIATTDGQTVMQDTPLAAPPPRPQPPTPPALQPMQAKALVSSPIYAPQGDIAGVLLADGTALRIPPPAVVRLGNLLDVGNPISAKGFGINTAYGRAIQVTAIGRDRDSEQQILPPPPPPQVPYRASSTR